MICFICKYEIYSGESHYIRIPVEGDQIAETVHKACVEQILGEEWYDVGENL